MFSSIHWRLITSYISLALFTIIVVGVLALWAAVKYFEKLEIDHLNQNGQAIAEEAYPYLKSSTSDGHLIQLVQAASFFSDMRVKILDNSGEILVDSGAPEEKDQNAWVVIYPEYQNNLPNKFIAGDWYISITGSLPKEILDKLSAYDWQELLVSHIGSDRIIPSELLHALPRGTSLNILQRAYSPWGSVLSFIEQQELNMPDSAPPLNYLDDSAIKNEEINLTQRSSESVSVPIGDEQNPLGYVELSQGLDFSSQALVTFRQALIIAAVGAVIVSIILGWFTGGRISSPIVALTETTAQMSSGSLAIRATVSGKDEIGKLAIQFNDMVEQLEQSFNQLQVERDTLRRFIADASHEMRTPITALRNFNDLLLSHGGNDLEIQREFLKESKTQIERLTWLTNNLLDLSRLDAGIIELNYQSTPVEEIINTAASGFERSMREKNIAIEINNCSSYLDLYGDRERIEIALRNVIDNAIKYSPPDGIIDITVEEEGEFIHISVTDDGPGIHPDDLPYIFDRFYLGVHNSQPGNGLGLAIVKSILEAHGGQVDVRSKPGSGAIIKLIFPSTISG